jgi:hypothetical protein
MDLAQCSLAELMDDPLIRLVMKSDGIDRREVELLFEQLTRERSQRPGPPTHPQLCRADRSNRGI